MTRPGRRALLAGVAGLLLAGRAAAQEAEAPSAPPSPAPAAPEAPAPAAPRRRPRRRVARRTPPPAPEPPSEPPASHLDAAPVPNRSIEGPRIAAPRERATLAPSIIHRPLPQIGAAREGSRNYDEERLFFPAPGARLTVPF